MAYEDEYVCLRDLEIEGRLQLDDENVAQCVIHRANAAYRKGEAPTAEEFEGCVLLLNELKDKLNALVGALT